MSNRQPHWRQYCPIGNHMNFLQSHTKNCKKRFFYIRAIYSSFWYLYPNPGYHQVNPHVLRIPKMSYFLGVRLFKGELLAVKVNRLWKFGSVTKNKRCCKKKTRPQFWFFGLATESVWVPPCGTHADSVATLKTQNCGRVFFLQRRILLLKKIEKWLNFDSQ